MAGGAERRRARPRARRAAAAAAAAWWFVPALLGGGYWYLRNLIVAGSPMPEIEQLGPISLPHPERLQDGRPDFDIAHYATDTGVWRHYFVARPARRLRRALAAGPARRRSPAALLAIFAAATALVRWLGGVALFGLLAYLFTPLGAAGAEGEPVGFAINIRYVIPALLAGARPAAAAALPRRPKRQWGLLAVLVLVFLVTDRSDDALRDPARLFALAWSCSLVVAVPTRLCWLAAERGLPAARSSAALRGAGAGRGRDRLPGPAPLPRRTASPTTGAEDDGSPAWTSTPPTAGRAASSDARIGLAGTTAGFAGYGFYGTDLSNEVVYLGEEGPHGAFNAIPTCQAFRAAVNDADLDYLVTSPFLNFIHPEQPDPLARGALAARRERRDAGPPQRPGHRLEGRRSRLDPAACGPANAPLREIPDTPH